MAEHAVQRHAVLHGPLQGKLRYAIGGLRIVYTVDTEKQIVSIVSIRNRGEAYK